MPRERFVEAALAIIDQRGVDAVSMRAVARHVGSGTATLYRHFDGRADLLDQVVDLVMAQAADRVDLAESADWKDELRAVARSVFESLGRHPDVIPLLSQHLPGGSNARAARERTVQLLLDQGCSPRLAALGYATLARFVLGFAIQHHVDPGGTIAPPDPAERGGTRPASAAIAAEVPIPLDDEFDFGLELLLVGLASTIEGGRATTTR